VLAAFESPVNFIDTSNGYGEDGLAERRIGAAIRQAGGLPSHVVLATKVDPDPRTGDFSGDRVRASVEESMERLGVEKIALLHLHDPERISFEEGVAPGGPVESLVDLRERGLVDHLGVAGGPVRLLQQYLDTGEFEVVPYCMFTMTVELPVLEVELDDSNPDRPRTACSMGTVTRSSTTCGEAPVYVVSTTAVGMVSEGISSCLSWRAVMTPKIITNNVTSAINARLRRLRFANLPMGVRFLSPRHALDSCRPARSTILPD
jgi:hypothetical protein